MLDKERLLKLETELSPDALSRLSKFNSNGDLVFLSFEDAGLESLNPLLPYLEMFDRLNSLNLRSNSLKSLELLSEFKNVKNLNVEMCDLNNLNSIKGLTHLKKLVLESNQISDIESLSDLIELVSLDLSHNRITDISSLKNLRKLKYLSLFRNEISDISPLSTLTNLVALHLSGNKIKNIKPLKELQNLNLLGLWHNRITDISDIKLLKKLQTLYLWDNPIHKIPEWITEFDMEIEWNDQGKNGFITLGKNPIDSPPIEIIKKGKSAIKRYFNQIKKEGTDYIYEAKLTLVGDGSSGKTSLQRRLLNENASLPRKDKRTRGIEIKDWKFTTDGKKHVAHVWDFGGQDVYYPVHRFFMTENSLFVLMASTRVTYHNFEYWIPTIYQFGSNSPIILIQNCHDGSKMPWNDIGTYIGNSNFNIIKTQQSPYYEINLPNKNYGLRKIRSVLIDQIVNLPHYGKGVPSSWVLIRNKLVQESKLEACISFKAVIEMCKSIIQEIDILEIKDCCQFLHDIGIILWYSSNEDLKSWIILQPEWAMNAVYRIIDDEEIQERHGNIIAKDFTRLWNEEYYDDKQLILKKMLEVFKIAFPKQHSKGDYIIPARLPSMPNERKWNNDENYLRLTLQFDFMPRGITNQLSAELSSYIISNKDVWNNAVNFCFPNNIAIAQVVEDFYNRTISIKCKGIDARALMVMIVESLKNVSRDYKGVQLKISVPCICSQCKTLEIPTVFDYNKLLEWQSKKKNATVVCNESGTTISITDLLFTVGLTPTPPLKKTNKTINIFLASSSELQDDRQQFEIFINRENKKLNKKGFFLNLNVWEDFVDAMSKTRLQDEYNKAVKNCDIFITLFFTKVGKYTKEEFEVAFGEFKETNKPFVYTYFKEGNIDISKISSADIKSKEMFIDRLRELEHFPTVYKNVDDLKYKFQNQLDKLDIY